MPLETMPEQIPVTEHPEIPINNPAPLAPAPAEHLLDASERTFFTDIQAALDHEQQTIAALNNQAAGGIRMLLKVHSLPGNWDLAPDYSRLICKTESKEK